MFIMLGISRMIEFVLPPSISFEKAIKYYIGKDISSADAVDLLTNSDVQSGGVYYLPPGLMRNAVGQFARRVVPAALAGANVAVVAGPQAGVVAVVVEVAAQGAVEYVAGVVGTALAGPIGGGIAVGIVALGAMWYQSRQPADVHGGGKNDKVQEIMDMFRNKVGDDKFTQWSNLVAERFPKTPYQRVIFSMEDYIYVCGLTAAILSPNTFMHEFGDKNSRSLTKKRNRKNKRKSLRAY
jgi:hypothetical protein